MEERECWAGASLFVHPRAREPGMKLLGWGVGRQQAQVPWQHPPPILAVLRTYAAISPYIGDPQRQVGVTYRV